jgi:hypothetical protein
MGHHEKQSIVSIIGSVLVIGFYSLYVYRNYIQADMELLNDFQFWGKSFLYLIPVAIVVQIVIQILFAIANRIITQEDLPDITDERDKLIELKSIRISHWIFILSDLCWRWDRWPGNETICDVSYPYLIRIRGQPGIGDCKDHLLQKGSVIWTRKR